ncbi:MAG UNVERIFIED_CONTAM: CoA transferase [Rickettsiaceae bacterium]|jgi:crotonobetainyl-CoA:carnitine CoA-transferase CaiB-like acyl-CoA transferase
MINYPLVAKSQRQLNQRAFDAFLYIIRVLGLNNRKIDNVLIYDKDPILPSPYFIGESGSSALATIGYIASELWVLKKHKRQKIMISVKDAAIAQRSHQYVRRLDGKLADLWDPISGFYETKDNKWIQFHCNFAHHKAGILNLLGCDDIKEEVRKFTKSFDGEYLETTLSERGMCASLVRTSKEWETHPQSKAISSLPLIEIVKIGNFKPKQLPSVMRPLSGIKVLDLTRIIAGPVCGKTLAEHGADVVLVNSPNLPNIEPLVIDTGHGKESLHCDMNNERDRQNLTDLIKKCDIFSQSYRPGSLHEKGFSPSDLVSINPNIIYVDFSPYSHVGPWNLHHGFDSLVQSVSGIANVQGGAIPKHFARSIFGLSYRLVWSNWFYGSFET